MLLTDSIKTKEELTNHHNSLYEYKVYPSTKSNVDNELLLDMVMAGKPTHKVKALRFLANNLVCYNIWMGTSEEIGEALGVSKKRAGAILSELSKDKSLKISRTGNYIIHLAPWYGWKAQESIREVYFENYIKTIDNSD